MYPSGFSAICRVHCTEAEICGVDSPLDKLKAIGVRVGLLKNNNTQAQQHH